MKIYFLALTILVAIPIQVKGVIELQMNSKFSAVPVVFDRYFRCVYWQEEREEFQANVAIKVCHWGFDKSAFKNTWAQEHNLNCPETSISLFLHTNTIDGKVPKWIHLDFHFISQCFHIWISPKEASEPKCWCVSNYYVIPVTLSTESDTVCLLPGFQIGWVKYDKWPLA